MGGWAIALHGGAGVIPQWKMTAERREAYEAALREILNIGVKALERNLCALDVVERVVKALEDDTLFNAGTGSVLSNKGTVEMESCIMEGKSMNSGAVSGLSTVLHPVSLARLVMEKSPHVYLAFQGAEEFARMQGVETVDMKHFITQENEDRLTSARKTNSIQLDFEDFPEHPTPLINGHGNGNGNGNGNGHVHANGNGYKENGGNGYAHVNGNGYKDDRGNGYAHAGRNGFKENGANGYIYADENGFKDKGGNGYVHADAKCYNGNGIHTLKAEFETVGCVAVDSNGNCAAATSTGGLVNKMCGRIGDTPIVGAGTYANHMCGVSATGRGEELIKATVAREVAAMMEYKEMSLTSAVDKVVYDRLPKNMGGLVAVSATGEIAMAYNTPGMFRASAHEGGPREVGI